MKHYLFPTKWLAAWHWCTDFWSNCHSSELRYQCPFVCLILTPHHLAAWRTLAREHQNWQARHWCSVLFTDENRFNLSGSNGWVRVWRSTGGCYQACNIVQHDRFGGGSAMVWGGISLKGLLTRGTAIYIAVTRVPLSFVLFTYTMHKN